MLNILGNELKKDNKEKVEKFDTTTVNVEMKDGKLTITTTTEFDFTSADTLRILKQLKASEKGNYNASFTPISDVDIMTGNVSFNIKKAAYDKLITYVESNIKSPTSKKK